MTVEQMVALLGPAATALHANLEAQVGEKLTVVLTVANTEGWANFVRGDRGGRAELALERALEDVRRPDGWHAGQPPTGRA